MTQFLRISYKHDSVIKPVRSGADHLVLAFALIVRLMTKQGHGMRHLQRGFELYLGMAKGYNAYSTHIHHMGAAGLSAIVLLPPAFSFPSLVKISMLSKAVPGYRKIEVLQENDGTG